ncbi:hypothetical protein HFN80_17080 [Rhizobium laguerreae]|uniref:papain-like cysteine protease family protein n=1 Tax=Rhizobium laguerreae TaxID=1076926 RepID=UPI001C90D533|nr:papain-like cysteine protease family protein [Rhizobium laguerreae]MBY3465702.1 hypothetical protein [Rhizobium laguerreae]
MGDEMPLPAFLNAKHVVLEETEPRFRPQLTGGAAQRSKRLALSIDAQEQSNWCWAAVSCSVSHFYDESAWTQCAIANLIWGRGDCCGGEASNPSTCNAPWKLDEALSVTSNFVSLVSADLPAPPIAFSAVQREIDHGKPVATRVRWRGGGGHFQAIVGWTLGASGSEYIVISDPIYRETTIRVRDFAARYQAGGEWTHVYFTTAASENSGGGGIVLQSKRLPADADEDLVGA